MRTSLRRLGDQYEECEKTDDASHYLGGTDVELLGDRKLLRSKSLAFELAHTDMKSAG